MKFLAKKIACFGMIGLIHFGSSAQQTSGAVAMWAEEMDAAPNVNHPGRWGAHDDADGSLVGIIEALSTGPDGATGVWKIPQESPSGGMAALDGPVPPGGGAISPLPPQAGVSYAPSPANQWLQWTMEARYRINTTVIDDITVVYPADYTVGHSFAEAYPFAIDVSNGNAPGLKYKDGWRSDTFPGPTYYQLQNNEGSQGGEFYHPNPEQSPPDGLPQSARDMWHVVRMQGSYTATEKFQRFYLDGVLINEFDTSEMDPVLWNRSIYVRQEGQGPGVVGNGDEARLLRDFIDQETMMDYIRITEGIIPISEALLAPGGIVFDEADFDQDGDVDTADYNTWRTNFGLASGATKDQGDSSADGDVDGADFLKWQAQHGNGGASIGAVPEPLTWSTLLLGCSLLASRRRR